MFAVPGNIFQRQALGTNKLIQQGAKLVTGVADILEELNLALVSEQRRRPARRCRPMPPSSGCWPACRPSRCISTRLGNQVGLPISQVSGALALMELKGMVRQVGGMQYVIAKEPRASYSVD